MRRFLARSHPFAHRFRCHERVSLRGGRREGVGLAGKRAWILLLGLVAASSAVAQDLAHRQSRLSIRVVDAAGQPVEDAEVRLELINPDFYWGTALNGGDVLPGTSLATKDYLGRYFNSVTFGNDLKWGPFEGTSPDQIRRRVRSVEVLPAFGITGDTRLRAHVTIWSEQAPNNIANSTDPADLRERIDGHIDAYFTTLRPWLDEYDMYNEPGNARALIAKLHPTSNYPNVTQAEINEIAAWFQRAQALQPEARLALNEYNILNDWNGNDARVHQYKTFIDRIRDAGGPIGVIGVQGHLDRIITYEQFVRRFAILAAPMAPTANHPEGLPGLPIEVTELDINPNVATDEQEAVMVDALLRAAYESPAVTGVTMWGLSDQGAWRRNAILVDADWNLKPSGEAWLNRIFGAYWTSEHAFTPAAGVLDWTVFRGTYRVSVRAGGIARSFEVAAHDDTTVDLALTPPGPIHSYADWLDHYFFESRDAMRQLADPDGDGVNNRAEFLLGTDPLDPSAFDAFQLLGQDAESGEAVFRFTVRTAARDDLALFLQRSDVFPFALWTAQAQEPILVGTEQRNEGSFSTYEWRLPWPTRNAIFYRLSMESAIPED